MEIPTPSVESIGKFFGGVLVTIAAAWTIVKKYGIFDKEEKTVEEPRLRRAEDSSIRIATEYLEGEIRNLETRLETKFEKRIADERSFLMGQINACENRITEQVQEVGRRIDVHYQGVNERLDILIRGK